MVGGSSPSGAPDFDLRVRVKVLKWAHLGASARWRVSEGGYVPGDELPTEGLIQSSTEDCADVLDRARRQAFGMGFVQEPLDLLGSELADLVPAERGDDVFAT